MSYKEMYVVPKHLYEAYQNQGDRAVREAVSSINIRQINNISDQVKSIQANDIMRGGQQRTPSAVNNSPPGGGNLGGDVSGPGTPANFGQMPPTDVTNFGQMRDGREGAREILPQPPPPPSHNDSDRPPPTSFMSRGISPPPSQTGATQSVFNTPTQRILPVAVGSTQTDNATNTIGVQARTPSADAATQTINDTRTVEVQATPRNRDADAQTESMRTREMGMQATMKNSDVNTQTENNVTDASTQAATAGVSTSTGTDSVWDFENNRRPRNAVLARRSFVIPTQTDFPAVNVVNRDMQTDAPSTGDVNIQTETAATSDLGVQVSPTLPATSNMGTQISPPPPPATSNMGTQISPPPPRAKRLVKFSPAHTHVSIPSSTPGRDASIQTDSPRRPQLSLASQLAINVPPAQPIARRTATSSVQTDPPTAVATFQPLARSVASPRPSWTFKIPRVSVLRNRVQQRPLGLARQRQQQRRNQLAITYQPSPKKKTPTKKRERKAPVKFSPEMIRRVNRKKGESKAAFAARRRLNLDNPVASSSTQQPDQPAAAPQSNDMYANPAPSTSSQSRRGATAKPRWLHSKPVKRTAAAAHMDTPLSKAKVAEKKGRPNKGEKRSVPTTFTSQPHKRGKKD
jgi:hypothetical protein